MADMTSNTPLDHEIETARLYAIDDSVDMTASYQRKIKDIIEAEIERFAIDLKMSKGLNPLLGHDYRVVQSAIDQALSTYKSRNKEGA